MLCCSNGMYLALPAVCRPVHYMIEQKRASAPMRAAATASEIRALFQPFRILR